MDGFSHIDLLWWCHLLDDEMYRSVTECEKPYRQAPAKLGIFATRSPVRPNPVALTTVYVSKIDLTQGVIYIPYVDAEDGTPIIDIKPYHPSGRVRDLSVPEWCNHWPKWQEESANFDWESEFIYPR